MFAAHEVAGGSDPECGCRLALLGEAVLAPRANFAYAPGVSARLHVAGRPPLELVATEADAAEGARRLALHPWPAGPAEALIRPDGTAELRLGDARWTGRREAEGLTRGRPRERLILEGPEGAAVLAVNWDPARWRAEGARLLAPLR
jgi:hypothetical protein